MFKIDGACHYTACRLFMWFMRYVNTVGHTFKSPSIFLFSFFRRWLRTIKCPYKTLSRLAIKIEDQAGKENIDGDLQWSLRLYTHCAHCPLVRTLFCPAVFGHFSPPPWKHIGRYESNKPIKSKLTYRQSINQPKDLQWKSTLDWLIDLIHGRKHCLTGMISGWVLKVTEHRGTTQYVLYYILHFLTIRLAYEVFLCLFTNISGAFLEKNIHSY